VGVSGEQELNYWISKLDLAGIKWTGFREPDRNNEITAIACLHNGGFFKKLRLL
jgi:hypothetical protein